MQIRRIVIGHKKTIRHKPYVISEVHVEMEGHFAEGEDLRAGIDEVSADVQTVLDEEIHNANERYRVYG